MSLFSPAQYLDDAGSNVRLAVGIGLALLLVVLLACRLGWRGLVVVLATVPLSVVTALLLLHLSGQGLNVLVVAGLAAAVTVLVDEAVVASERVATRLRSRMQNGGPVPVLDHVRHAVEDIRTPLIYASLVELLAVVPVLVMAGRPGAFFAPLAWAYLAAVVAAVVVVARRRPGPSRPPVLDRSAGPERRPGPAARAGGLRLAPPAVRPDRTDPRPRRDHDPAGRPASSRSSAPRSSPPSSRTVPSSCGWRPRRGRRTRR